MGPQLLELVEKNRLSKGQLLELAREAEESADLVDVHLTGNGAGRLLDALTKVDRFEHPDVAALDALFAL